MSLITTVADDAVKVLVADDEPVVRSLFGTLLAETSDCELHLAADGEQALEMVLSCKPDVLITDLRMPRMSGEELAARALDLNPDVTILVETGNPTLEGAVNLMRGGVYDFITKPFSIDALQATLERVLERSKAKRRERSVDAIVESLMTALETKDPYLKGHCSRVSRYAERVGRDIGMPEAEIEPLVWAALVHDVGKIGVSEAILHKRGKLTESEFEAMKRHPLYSVEIIRPLSRWKGGKVAEKAVYHHHERIDGKGYPDGIAGDTIPLESRIIAVCDTYDAMASERPYRDGLPDDLIRKEIRAVSGKQLDSRLAKVFLDNMEEYVADVVASK